MDGNNQSGGESTEQPAEPSPTTDAAHKEILDIIQLADSKTRNPDERAQLVWEVLKASPRYNELSTWDIVCFAGNGVAMFHTFHPWLEDAAKNLARLMHTIHYANWETIVQQEKDAKLKGR